MKVDCHVHLTGAPEHGGGNPFRRGINRLGARHLERSLGLHKLDDPDERDQAYADRLAEMVDDSELDRAVLLAFDQVYSQDGEPEPQRTYLHVPNGRAARICAAHPAAFLLGASVHPYRADALDELDRATALGAALIKLLPNSHGFDPADDRLGPYYRKLADLELPLLIHGGYEHTLPVVDQRFGDPLRLRLALESGVTVIVAHCGSAGRFHVKETFGAFLELAATYPNCYGDTSSFTNFWRSQYMLQLLDSEQLHSKYEIVPEDPFSRLVHGSDYPIPITPWALVKNTERHGRRTAARNKNHFQRDIELKRVAGLPDEILTRTAEVLGVADEPQALGRGLGR
ncbi:MAG: amidohydrolase family protein [Deltaproteobacteria bacterium]|nr:amidohydrolase family protein [Deltaproteobacteria bacterium]